MESEAIISRLWPRLLREKQGVPSRPRRLGREARAWWELYAPIAAGGPGRAIALGQLGQSLDGRIATPTGHSHYVNGSAAIDHLHRLRALADAVVVGIGTVLADDPLLTVRRVPGPQPARVVIDPNGRLPARARLLAEDGRPVFVIEAAARPRPARVIPIALPMRDRRLAPAEIVAALAARGLHRLLIEGGAATVSAFLAAGALDHLHLSVAPLVIGSGPIGLQLPPIDRLDGAHRPAVTIHRLGPDVLFDCRFR
jgi:diaminohydroxyphosphoribosylaminopyrimidine deaminase/5-amino-6-(5-phosphoribosylamino)uracil reductase